MNSKGINTIFRNNLYFNIAPHESDSSPNIADPRFASPGEAESDIDLMTMDALRGYRLEPGSPGINAGIDISDHGGRDLLKVRVETMKANIGAFESGP